MAWNTGKIRRREEAVKSSGVGAASECTYKAMLAVKQKFGGYRPLYASLGKLQNLELNS